MPKKKSANKHKNKAFKTGLNSSKEFVKTKNKQPAAVVVAPRKFRSVFDEGDIIN